MVMEWAVYVLSSLRGAEARTVIATLRAVTVYFMENAAKKASSRVGGAPLISTSASEWNNRLCSDRCGKTSLTQTQP